MSGDRESYIERELAGEPDVAPEQLHWTALRHERQDVESRGLLRCARNLLSFEVAPLHGAGPYQRLTLPELLVHEPRVLVVGAQGSGKSALVAHLALRAVRELGRQGVRPFIVPAGLLEPGERLTEASIARMSPALGRSFSRQSLAEGRALVLVDGLDGAPGGPAALVESIPAFARAHPGNRFVVTTRPIPTGIPGRRRTELPEFTTAVMLAPLVSSRVHPAHRFLGRRSPDRKAALYLERAEALLDAWAQAVSAPGSVAGRMPRADQRELWSAVAWTMHDDRSYEIAASDLLSLLRRVLSGEAEGGPIHTLVSLDATHPSSEMRCPPTLALALLRAIREHPALLFERRPGFFAFTDFALQEVLAARWMPQAREPDLPPEMLDDPWWHGILELDAGLSGAEAAALVRTLLDTDPDSPAAALLAARCAEAAHDLPGELRRTADLRVAAHVPPMSHFGAERLAQVVDVVAPLLLRALPRCDAEQRAFSALVLGRLHHEPACAALLAMSTDKKRVKHDVSWPVGGFEVNLVKDPVAVYALAALFELARVSKVGKRAFHRAVKRAPQPVIEAIYLAIHRAVEGTPDDAAPDVYELLDEIEAERLPWLTIANPRR